MSDKKNIYEKLQKARVDLQAKEIKKSGFNKFSNYKYFELEDILPPINEVANENRLTNIFYFEKDRVFLHVIDMDNPESKIVFRSPSIISVVKGCNELQSIGSSQTYMRRYMYIMAYELAEHDEINQSTDIDEEEQERIKFEQEAEELRKKKIDKTDEESLLVALETKGVKAKQIYLEYHIESLSELTKGQLMEILTRLSKMKNKPQPQLDI